METLTKIILAPFLLIGSLLGMYNQNAGATLPQGVAIFQTSLQSPITSSATSMTLTSNSVRGGNTLSGYNCFTIDEGSAQAEYVCGTVSGTTVSSLTRGIDPLTATTTNATLQFAHRRGASVKITDFPLIQVVRNQLSGLDNLPGILFYTQDNTFSSSTQLVSKSYVDSVAIAGAPDSTESVKGITELATQIEMASSTVTGSTGASLSLYSKYSTSSPYTSGLWIPITRNDGKLSPQFIATSSVDIYNFGGAVSIATSTINTLNVGTVNATSSINLNGTMLALSATSTTYTATSSPHTWTKPNNAKKVFVEIWGAGGGGGGAKSTVASPFSGGSGGGGAYNSAWYNADNLSSTVTITIGVGGAGGVGVTPTAGSIGGTTTFGSYLSAYGGGGGGADSMSGACGGDSGGGEGGGGGIQSAGSSGGTGGCSGNPTGGAGGSPMGGVSAAGATNQAGTWHNSIYGGGVGSGKGTNAFQGSGASVFGGGGGGANSVYGGAGGGGTSVFGGNGGASNQPGLAPGGGGGGASGSTVTSIDGKAGGDGKAIITVFY